MASAAIGGDLLLDGEENTRRDLCGDGISSANEAGKPDGINSCPCADDISGNAASSYSCSKVLGRHFGVRHRHGGH